MKIPFNKRLSFVYWVVTLREYLNAPPIPFRRQLKLTSYLRLVSQIVRPSEEFKKSLPLGRHQKRNRLLEASLWKHKEVGRLRAESGLVLCRFQDDNLTGLLKECQLYPNKKFVILQTLYRDVGCVDQKIADQIPENVVRIYSKNVRCVHPKVRSIPIGRDFRNIQAGLYLENFVNERNFKNWVYSNFALSTNWGRVNVFERFCNKPWVTTIRVDQFLEYPISRLEFTRQVRQHPFVLAPKGMCDDTFRLWESLYLKSIPIVEDLIHYRDFKDLPILFTKDYSEISEEYLREKYVEMLDSHFAFEKLDVRYWQLRIKMDMEF